MECTENNFDSLRNKQNTKKCALKSMPKQHLNASLRGGAL